jgi:hypothetical protein
VFGTCCVETPLGSFSLWEKVKMRERKNAVFYEIPHPCPLPKGEGILNVLLY